MKHLISSIFLLLLTPIALAWNGPADTAGPLSLRIEGPTEIPGPTEPFPIAVVAENTGEIDVTLSLSAEGIDGWRVEGLSETPTTVSAQGSARLDAQVIPNPEAYTAIYPVHLFGTFNLDGTEHTLHPVLMVNVQASPAGALRGPVAEWRPFILPANKVLPLVDAPAHRTTFLPYTGDAITMHPGWLGTDDATGAVVSIVPQAEVAEPRRALSIHPPWQEGYAGALQIEYPIMLPDVTPITLRFDIARRSVPEDSGADGLAFRVRIGDEIVTEAHTNTSEWQPVNADLSAYAGQTILLQIEADPGTDRNTAFDLGYIADAMLTAGIPPDTTAPGPSIALGNISTSGGEVAAKVRLGACGLFDGVVEFTSDDQNLSFNGFDVRVLGEQLSAHSALNALEAVKTLSESPLTVRHTFRNSRGSFAITARLWVEENKALRIAFEQEDAPAPQPWSVVKIDSIALGPWSANPSRVYAGMGNVLVEPEAFELGMDGHRLATSFVGADFDGLSIVQGVDVPPDKMAYDPAHNHWSLHAPLIQVRTIIPATTAWEGVKVWRDLDPREAAAGVPRIAGRFVFDLWGGHYAPSAEALQQSIDYGLYYSAVVWHNWQHWGYDYRLPDIWPPNSDFGTLEEFQQLANVCMNNGLLFAPHDNYIDFYPDAPGFSYEHIAFNQQGEPVKGWWNWGREAQAYRWATDAVFPFLRENLQAIKAGIAPNSYFIDVWSSIGIGEMWTHNGMLIDRIHTRNEWGRSFAWIRDYLGNAAPQISESGHDQLIGWLDAAQANHLRVDSNPAEDAEWMVWKIQCEDAERIPWLDMAYHDRYILHGAGYEPRYSAGLDAEQHGIYSDDYMSTEVLTGHPAMVKEAFSRNVVRKYWLLGPIGVRLGRKQMDNVTFVDGDIHRQHVEWEGGGQVWVNRGVSDWVLGEHILPQYGFYAEAGSLQMAVEKANYCRLEWCRMPGFFYVQPRPEGEASVFADFGWIASTGGCRVAADNQKLVVTPLPESAEFTLRFRADQWPEDLPGFPDRRWEAVNRQGEVLESGPLAEESTALALHCKPEVFAYRVL